MQIRLIFLPVLAVPRLKVGYRYCFVFYLSFHWCKSCDAIFKLIFVETKGMEVKKNKKIKIKNIDPVEVTVDIVVLF